MHMHPDSTRLTTASAEIKNHAASLRIRFMHYDFTASIRRFPSAPAMEASASRSRSWTLHGIIGLLALPISSRVRSPIVCLVVDLGPPHVVDFSTDLDDQFAVSSPWISAIPLGEGPPSTAK